MIIAEVQWNKLRWLHSTYGGKKFLLNALWIMNEINIRFK